MKNRTVSLFVLAYFALYPNPAKAQRYLPGQVGIQITGGIAPITELSNWHVGAGFSKYTKNGNRWLYGLEYLNNTYPYKNVNIPITQMSAEAGYYINVLSDRRKVFFLSTGLSAMAGYETVNWGNKRLSDGSVITNRDRFIYGGALTLELETYLSDRVALLLNIRERVVCGSDTGRFYSQIGIGVKYIL